MKPIINIGITSQVAIDRLREFATATPHIEFPERKTVPTYQLTNCVNCGANDRRKGKCAYCGTNYFLSETEFIFGHGKEPVGIVTVRPPMDIKIKT